VLAGEEEVRLVAFADRLAALGSIEEGKGGEVGRLMPFWKRRVVSRPPSVRKGRGEERWGRQVEYLPILDV